MPEYLAEFHAERGRLFGLAYRLLGSASDAEDVLQETFLRGGSARRGPRSWSRPRG